MTTSDFVIETAGLTRYFGSKKAVDTVNMRVPRGSVFAFLGRNGSGKTTTIRMLLGLLRPTRGSSTVLGEDSQALSPGTRGRIGYMSESHSVHEWMTVAQAGYYQSQFFQRWNERAFAAVIGHFGLSLDARARNLSRGERAGLSLALTLAPEPELLILDDPAIGLDPVARRSLLESIIQVTRGSGRTVFFSSHLLDDVERVADYVGVLDRSVLRALCPIEAFQNSVVRFVLSFPTPPDGRTPPIRGLLSSRVYDNALHLILVRPTDETRRLVRALGPMSIEEQPVGFADAMTGYLGDRSGAAPLLNASLLSPVGGAS
jgi:ABC-2 type transport system ATP-binding protein